MIFNTGLGLALFYPLSRVEGLTRIQGLSDSLVQAVYKSGFGD